MSGLKYCQGPKCHTYDTKDRKRKDLKIIRGMKQEEDHHSIISMAMRVQCVCQADWFDVYGQRALDHFGRSNSA